MKIAHPTLIAVKLYESPEGLRFRPNPTNAAALWGKLAPVQVDSTYGRIVYYSRYICLVDVFYPYLLTTQHLLPGAPVQDIQRAVEPQNEKMHKCLIEYEYFKRIIENNNKAFEESMDHNIVTYYKAGIPVQTLCTMYQVGRTRVTGALVRRKVDILPPTPEQVARSKKAVAKNAALESRRTDKRYAAIKLMDQRLRSKAFGAGMECSYDRESLMDSSGPVLAIPDTCPVLGLPLVYINEKLGRGAYPDGTATIARYNPLKPYVNGNVLITCRLAARLIDGTLGMAARAKVFEDPALLRAWAAWRERTGI